MKGVSPSSKQSDILKIMTNTIPAGQKISRIRDEVVTAVRNEAKIEDIIGEYVTLKKSGSSYIGLCPFHDERSGSFHVSPGKSMFKCFGCGEGGDVISFLQKIDNSTFPEAVEKLCAKTGVVIEYTEGYRPVGIPAGIRTRLIDANTLAMRFYRNQMKTPDGQRGKAYLNDRGFDDEAIAAFNIGYSPASWDSLTLALKGEGYSEDELVTAGLAKKREDKEGVYDVFRGRLMWPIRDLAGDIIGFGARKFSDDDQGPKYLNTSETPLYHKSDILYGIDSARKAIAANKEVVIVEGYTDVMACHLAGVMNAVAACGTAFGEGHIKVIRRLMNDTDMFNGKVIFTFDGDGAGQKAALRAFKEQSRFTATTYVVIAPDGMDPAEIRQKAGAEGLRDLMKTAVPLAEFVIRTLLADHNLATIEGRTNALRGVSPVLAGIKDKTMQAQYIPTVSGWLGVDERHVIGAVQKALKDAQDEGKKTSTAVVESTSASKPDNSQTDTEEQDPFALDSNEPVQPNKVAQPIVAPKPKDPLYIAERDCLKCFLQFPELSEVWKLAMPESAFTHPAYAQLFEAIVTGKESNEEYSNLVTELSVEELYLPDNEKDYGIFVDGCFNRLLGKDYERQILEVKSRLARGEGDSSGLFDEILALEKLKKDLRNI